MTWQLEVWNIAYLTILDTAFLKSCLPTTFAETKLELARSNLTEDQLEDMLEQGQGAKLDHHVHIDGDADQLQQTLNDIENYHEMFMNLEKGIMKLHDAFLHVHELFVAVFNIVDGLPELICIFFNVSMANQLGSQTLLPHIFQLIFDRRYAFYNNAYNLFFQRAK